ERLLAGLENGSAEEASTELVAAAEAAAAVNLGDWRPRAQVRVFHWLKSRRPAWPAARRLSDLLGLAPL
ncbi:MAG: hypothetical protein HY403_05810, partial [Elusimicrobia bacterium]|nr:hypothetical protein [Elusimicrobiota bacterium]